MTSKHLFVSASLAAFLCVASVTAQPIDLNTLTELTYQPTNGFSAPDWQIVDAPVYDASGSLTGEVVPVAAELTNSYPTILHTTEEVLGNRITYIWRPGADDDLSGFVLGLDPGTPAAPATEEQNTRYLLFDWKRVEQEFNFADPLTAEGQPGDFINDSTDGTTAFATFRAGWVSGVPTADELWGKVSLPSVGSFPDTGGVTLIAEGAAAGQAGYNANGANQQYIVDIEYTADRVVVSLDGVEEFNFTPADVPGAGLTEFPQGRFGFYESHQSPGGIYTKLELSSLEAAAPTPEPLAPAPAPVLPAGVKAWTVDAINEDAEVDASAWSVAASTGGSSSTFVLSGPNNGDVDFGFGASFDPNDRAVQLGLKTSSAAPATPADGVTIATVAQNGGRARDTAGAEPIYGTAEAPMDSGFGGVRAGFAVAEIDGSESTTRVGGAFFPYSSVNSGVGFTAGVVGGDGAFVSSNSTFGEATVEASETAGLYSLSIGSRNANSDGLLLAVGGANNNNVVGAAPADDGSWSVSIRDNRARGGDEDFEASVFNYVYLDTENTEGLIGAYVPSFDASGAAEAEISVGDFTLVREDVGSYRLSIAGDTPDDGVLLLTNAEMSLLADQSTMAPANYYLTYQADGSDFLIEMNQLVEGSAPVAVDGAFTFAFVGYDGEIAAVPEPGTLTLALVTTAIGCLSVRRRRR